MKHIRDDGGIIPKERETEKNSLVIRQFLRLISSDEDVTAAKLRAALPSIITPRQFEFLDEYVNKFALMHYIAEKYGVSKSTVSRTLTRARDNLLKFISINADAVLALIHSANDDDIERLM